MTEKYRHEIKYVCDNSELIILEKKLESLMSIDSHANDSGEYLIRSIYFDDIYNSCYYDNENGNNPRSKFRIRTYDNNDSLIRLEKKIKKNGMTAKKSCILNKELCEKILRGERLIEYLGENPLLDDFVINVESKGYRPTILCEYRRVPFVYGLGNVRVTFDMDISASKDIEDFFSNNLSKKYIFNDGKMY